MDKYFWIKALMVVIVLLSMQLYERMDISNLLFGTSSEDETDESFSKDPEKNYGKVEKESMINYYINYIHEKKETVEKNGRMAFGYVADNDVYVNAIKLMKYLGFENPPETRKLHSTINSLEEFAETFAFYF